MKRFYLSILTMLLLGVAIIDLGCSKNIYYCPECKVALKTVPIVYAYGPDKEDLKKSERGELVLGGCVIKPYNPTEVYVCPKCKSIFFDERNFTSPGRVEGLFEGKWRDGKALKEQFK